MEELASKHKSVGVQGVGLDITALHVRLHRQNIHCLYYIYCIMYLYNIIVDFIKYVYIWITVHISCIYPL